MSLFIVRVELHGLLYNHPSYTMLNTAMERAVFVRTILYSGRLYHMPPAEYNKTSNESTQVILNSVKTIANPITRDNGVMVTKSAEFMQDGLRPI